MTDYRTQNQRYAATASGPSVEDAARKQRAADAEARREQSRAKVREASDKRKR